VQIKPYPGTLLTDDVSPEFFVPRYKLLVPSPEFFVPWYKLSLPSPKSFVPHRTLTMPLRKLTMPLRKAPTSRGIFDMSWGRGGLPPIA
jgi:hypothetical protein